MTTDEKKTFVLHESQGEIVPDICGTAIELINPETAGSTKLSFAELKVKPREGSRPHLHAKTEEVYFILRGLGKVIIGDEEYDVGPGHAIFLPVGVRHQIVNTGDEELVFVCADAPVFDPSDVIEI